MTTIKVSWAPAPRTGQPSSVPAAGVQPGLIPTVDRVVAAWDDAPPARRRLLRAACVIAALLGATVQAPATVCWSIAFVGVLLAVAAMVDVHECKLPNWLLAVAFVVVLGGAAATSDLSVVAAAVVGSALAGGPMLFVRLARGVGMGDVKMAGVVGASVGPIALFAAPVAVAVAALVAGTYGLVAGRRRLPLGPALWLGWAVSLAAAATGWPR
jgi:leader peptidase (prepilin peptidase)/N-methyltransferase